MMSLILGCGAIACAAAMLSSAAADWLRTRRVLDLELEQPQQHWLFARSLSTSTLVLAASFAASAAFLLAG